MDNYYMDLIKKDIIEPVMPLINRGTYKFTNDGRLEAETRMHSETPWVHIRQDPQKNCGLWHHVWFNYYGIIPSYCQQCWKVVVRPRTLTELFQVHNILVDIDLHSKCGIEKRYSVPALYGAYLYNNSLEEGRLCWNKVANRIHMEIGSHVRVILKRACTEFEEKFPDSTTWKVTDKQAALEARLERLFVNNTSDCHQSEEMKMHVMANWIRFAYAQGDPTASQYMSEPLYQPYHIYADTEEPTNGS